LPPISAGVAADSSALYLDLLERSLTNVIYGDAPIETHWWRVWRRPRYVAAARENCIDWPSRAHTMIGLRRLHALRLLVERTLRDNIAGDYIETGVWRGGACILMRGVLAAHGERTRRVFCADSFGGLPRPDDAYPADRWDKLHKVAALAVARRGAGKFFPLWTARRSGAVRQGLVSRHSAGACERTLCPAAA
jgi:hypothetical protein